MQIFQPPLQQSRFHLIASIILDIRHCRHAEAARRMIEAGIRLEEVEIAFKQRYGLRLPEEFVKAHAYENMRAFVKHHED
ncbi:MAG: hypothetical protein N3E51_01470 [Candidatus Micrarchaeota archaeon]|nr:hypothetical protein [Candidatus Micrarchaeota archaeon]